MEQVGDKELVTYLQENASISPLTERLANNLEWFKESPCQDMGKKLANFYYTSFPFMAFERQRRTIERIQYFENMLITTRADFLGKFYRDHVHHMLRVWLIASMIYFKLTKEMGIPLKRCDPAALAISSLFHDMAYPIQEAKVIFEGIYAGIKSIYQSMEIGIPDLSSYLTSKHADKILMQLAAINASERLTSLDEKEMYKLLKEKFYDENNPSGGFDHGVLSAVELGFRVSRYRTFGSKLIKPNTYDKALLAIALHNIPSVQVDLNAFPELYILILADELQEWGRPVFMNPEESIVVMPRIGIEVNKRKPPSINFHLDYSSKIKGFDPLRQLGSKGRAISRLKADCLNINLCMDVVYPYDDNKVFKLEYKRGEKTTWYIEGQDSISWIERKIQESLSGKCADLRTHMLVLLCLWDKDKDTLKKLLEMTGSALLTHHLCNPDDVSLYAIIVRLRIDDLRENCKDGLRQVLLVLMQICQEDYQKACRDTIRRKAPEEDFTLPEVGPASEEEINEAERKTLGQGDGAHYKFHIIMLRSICSSLCDIQEALDSIKQ